MLNIIFTVGDYFDVFGRIDSSQRFYKDCACSVLNHLKVGIYK